MKKGSHYPKRTLRLHRGDEIYCTYRQLPPLRTETTLPPIFSEGYLVGLRENVIGE